LPAQCALSDIEALCKTETENGDELASVKLASIKDKLEMAFPVYHALQIDGTVSSDVLLGWWLVQTHVHGLLGFMKTNFDGYVTFFLKFLHLCAEHSYPQVMYAIHIPICFYFHSVKVAQYRYTGNPNPNPNPN
jgi:hypothetical protein